MSTKNTKTSNKDASVNEKEDLFNETYFEMEEESEEDQGQWIQHLFSRNGNLSFACRGFLVFLFSHKPSFQISLKMIQNHLTNLPYKREKGRDYIRRLAREALENGFLSKIWYKNEKGLPRFRYKVHKKPVIKKMFREDGIAGFGNPVDKRISSLILKDDIEKIPLPKHKPKKAAKPTTPPSSAIIPLWFLKGEGSASIPQAEYDEKVRKYGEKIVDKAVSKIRELDSEYKNSKSGNGYKSKNLSKKIDDLCEELVLKKQRDKVILAEESKQKEYKEVEERIKKNKEFLELVELEYDLSKSIRKTENGISFIKNQKDILRRFSDDNFKDVLLKNIKGNT